MKKYVLVLCCIVCCLVVSHAAFAKELTIVVGLALPPYVIPETNSGMELDIVREALEMKGHTLRWDYVPFARVPLMLKGGKADGALTVNEASGLGNVFFSDSHITYQNVAVSLEESHFSIEKVSDLWDRKIVAFQNATLYLGQEFLEISKASPQYRELAEQENQIVMLYKKRTDLIILDVNIFKYYRQNTEKIDTGAPVVIHEIFPATFYKVGFLDEQIRDEFNEALAELKSSGRYEEIIKEYIKE